MLPFTWYSFKDTPDIVKLADLSVDLFRDEESDDELGWYLYSVSNILRGNISIDIFSRMIQG